MGFCIRQEESLLKTCENSRVIPVVRKTNSSHEENRRQTKGKKARIRSMVMDKYKSSPTPGRRTSIYRGVTRHRWTGRYEAHLWDKSCWNETRSRKGRQGAYDDEEAAARAYDLAALKYWGSETILNFPLSSYANDIQEMKNLSKEEYLASLRRKSSGFSRGVSKYRGVARHHHNGRWEARIGRVFGNKYLYLGTYDTQEEAAAAYDMAAIEHRGLNAMTNFDLSHYTAWLRPDKSLVSNGNSSHGSNPAAKLENIGTSSQQINYQDHYNDVQEPHLIPWSTVAPNIESLQFNQISSQPRTGYDATALELLVKSTKFKELLEKTGVVSGTQSDVSSSCDITLDVDAEENNKCIQYFSEDIDAFLASSDNGAFGQYNQDMFLQLASPVSATDMNIFRGFQGDNIQFQMPPGLQMCNGAETHAV
eukprot:Gb_18139 [translate_table: standard]